MKRVEGLYDTCSENKGAVQLRLLLCFRICKTGFLMTRLNYLATPGLEGIKIFSCSSLLSMKFILLMNVKMHKINGILIFEPRRDKTNVLHLRKQRRSLIYYYYYCDQHRSYGEADQRLCFSYVDSTISFLSKSESSSL